MKKRLSIVGLLVLFMALAIACGNEPAADEAAPEPTASPTQPVAGQVQVDKDPPLAKEQAVAEPATKAAPEPEAPPLKKQVSGVYAHPSGAFSVRAFGSEYEEIDPFTFFYGPTGLVIAFYDNTTVDLNDNTLDDTVAQFLRQAFVEPGVLNDFEAYTAEAEVVNDGYLVYFTYTSNELGDGEGEIFITQAGQTAGMVLLAPNYSAAADAWFESVESFAIGAEPAANVPPAAEKPASTGRSQTYASDSGFRPPINGFSFFNYGNDEVSYNLTAAELRRMFGDQVCASLAGGACSLTPPARQWLEKMNGYMDGGHCEGMAVLSSLMYYDKISPETFGGNTAHELRLSNEALQREIAYWWTTQGVSPAAAQLVNDSPAVVLDTLIDSFSQGQAASEAWVMGIYKSDFTGGHAITPFAVEDQGDGLYQVLVYDNNFPDESRILKIDRNDNTWQYQASTNPDEPTERYDGTAELQNLELVAVFPRLKQQDCPFCAGAESAGRLTPGLASQQPKFYEIWLEGDADLLIIDEAGQRIGFDNGRFINEIPGAHTLNFRFQGVNVWEADEEPVYRVPVGTAFEIIIDASRMKAPGISDVSMIGPGFFLAVEEIWLEPGDQDSIFVETDQSRHHLTYGTDYADSPLIILGVETPAADFAFLVQATELVGAEDTFDVAIDLDVGDFIIDTGFNVESSTYDVAVLRIDDDGDHIFAGPDLVMEPDTTLFLNYLEWKEDGSVMYADFDNNNDGQIDETFELPDEGEDTSFFDD